MGSASSPTTKRTLPSQLRARVVGPGPLPHPKTRPTCRDIPRAPPWSHGGGGLGRSGRGGAAKTNTGPKTAHCSEVILKKWVSIDTVWVRRTTERDLANSARSCITQPGRALSSKSIVVPLRIIRLRSQAPLRLRGDLVGLPGP